MSTLTTIITFTAGSLPGVQARAATPIPTAVTTACGNSADQSELVFDVSVISRLLLHQTTDQTRSSKICHLVKFN